MGSSLTEGVHTRARAYHHVRKLSFVRLTTGKKRETRELAKLDGNRRAQNKEVKYARMVQNTIMCATKTKACMYAEGGEKGRHP